tara:strand:+ start:486 stop:758 length:273 start_codon:yes stop_codon:yes gene_type:complete
MNNIANLFFISVIGLIFLISNLLLIKIKWENAVMSGQLDRLNLENTKLQEINLKLNTEKYFLSSLSLNERIALEELQMVKTEPVIYLVRE